MSKIRQTPRYLNRKAQLLAEMDSKSGSSGSQLAAAKLKKRGSMKGKRNGGSTLSPEVEQQLQEQLDAEVWKYLSTIVKCVQMSITGFLVIHFTCRPDAVMPTCRGFIAGRCIYWRLWRTERLEHLDLTSALRPRLVGQGGVSSFPSVAIKRLNRAVW